MKSSAPASAGSVKTLCPSAVVTRESPLASAGESGQLLLHSGITFLTTPFLWFTNAPGVTIEENCTPLLHFISLNKLLTVVNNELMNPKEDSICPLFEHYLRFQLNDVDSRNTNDLCV